MKNIRLFVVVLAALTTGAMVFAQLPQATITGVVTDVQTAVIAQALITVRNVDTNISRTMNTSVSGDYTITNLPPGSYELKCEMEGFRTYVKTGIVLEVGQMLRSDIQLELGAVSESVTVTAEVAALNTESGTIKGDVIVQQELQDLPLDGRDFKDLALLVPGVTEKVEGQLGGGLNVNGARSDSGNYYVDGFSTRAPLGGTPMAHPNMSSLQEFRMEVSGFSSEYGRMAGGVMNMALRSGTNEFHGDIFEFVRNNVIDARAFFDQEKQKLNRHQFGATLHGPVILPKVYNGRNRTFFMFSWESYRQLIGRTQLSQVPSLLERSGDFSQSLNRVGKPVAVRDPLNKNRPFHGNRIPADRYHPTAVKLLDYYPLPNRATIRNNYFTSANNNSRWNSFVWKIDHRFDDKNSVSYRHTVRIQTGENPFGGSTLGTFGSKNRTTTTVIGIDYTHLFSPNFLVEARGGVSGYDSLGKADWAGSPNIAMELGIPGTTTDPDVRGFPAFRVLNYAQIGSNPGQPNHYIPTEFQGGVKFTWVRSRHVMKWGYDLARNRTNEPLSSNTRGTFQVQDRWTGHSMGDFLLGLPNSTTRGVGSHRVYMRAVSMGAFFNDDWKVTPTLTLNLGLRYELALPVVDRYDRMSNFVPGVNKLVLASPENIPDLEAVLERTGMTDLVTFASEASLPRSLMFPDYTNWAPRVGFAWRPFGSKKTVIRGGYGIFYTGYGMQALVNSMMSGFPFQMNENYPRLPSQPNLLTFSNPFPQQRVRVQGTLNMSGYEADAPTPYLQTYNFTLERSVGGGAVLEVAWGGSKGTHLPLRYDYNQPVRSMEAYLAGIPTQELRPIPTVNTINYTMFGVNSIYNSGQISLRKRGRGGTFYRLNYTYSKSIDLASAVQGASRGGFAGAQNSLDLRAERGRSDWDRGHVVTLNFSWQVPAGRGRRLLGSARGLTQGLLGGWQFSGTGRFGTGAPLTPQSTGIDQNLGEAKRPNRLGTGLQEEIPGAGRKGVDYPWFKLSDFEMVPRCDAVEGCNPSPNGFLPFQYGNSGRGIVDGMGYAHVNLALLKNFRFAERKKLQLRLESFNVMNRPSFNTPNVLFNGLTGGLVTQSSGSRVFQAALKFDF